MNDEGIVALFWERNEAAIAKIQEKYGRYCQYIAERILGSREDAEECVNDTYRRAWETIPPSKPSLLSSYLAMLTRRIAIDRARENRAGKRGGGLDLILDELQECVSDTQADDAHSQLLREVLDTFLASLPQRTRKVFVRRYWYADTAAAIAKEYGMSESNVNTLLFRTRKQLKKALQENGIEP